MAINAHGGGILHFNEIKSGETYLPEANQEWGGTRVNLTGISCYSSQDLLNWKFRGNVLHSVEDNSEHDLYWENVAERPKVIFNAMTGMFVMWLHIDSMDYSKARVGVASSSSPIGPFDYLSSFRPNNQMARDLTVFVDDDDEATAYLLTSSEDNAVMHISQLSDDYLAVRTDLPFHRVFIGRYMEAPTLFKSQGFYYFIGSGCTAWEPNAARSAVAKSIDGPWRELGNPAIGPDSNNTFSSQSTFVLPMDGSNRQGRFIFMADRWVKDDLASSRYVWLHLSSTKIAQ
ncbi:hypothetical protein THAOC_08039 [Thalassiosira oceanica]|uniref:Glycosyl hydrolase family 43 protein n=1 Tax=Thalassiosira oceanica TaxID=159749 RepID=K0T055_THAOC|nr:hypothetical protein THAOC_08039 [Thalassiosira oceanica]|eukprot:EJK70589.1 hypothetical protein THAOC_08039 [Thalassiosira oceanica]